MDGRRKRKERQRVKKVNVHYFHWKMVPGCDRKLFDIKSLKFIGDQFLRDETKQELIPPTKMVDIHGYTLISRGQTLSPFLTDTSSDRAWTMADSGSTSYLSTTKSDLCVEYLLVLR